MALAPRPVAASAGSEPVDESMRFGTSELFIDWPSNGEVVILATTKFWNLASGNFGILCFLGVLLVDFLGFGAKCLISLFIMIALWGIWGFVALGS